MKFITYIARIIIDIFEKKILVYGAQAAFFLLVSAIPFFMLLLNIFYFIPSANIESLLEFISPYFTTDAIDMFRYITGVLSRQSNNTTISISLIFVIWTASSGIYALEAGLNQIYGSTQLKGPKGWLLNRARSFIYILILVVSLVVMASIMVLSSRISILIINSLPFEDEHHIVSNILNFFVQYGYLIGVPGLMLGFMSLYTFFPGRKVKFRSQFWGASIATLSWFVFTYFYGIYIQIVTSRVNIYGSLSAIFMLMMWVYISCIIVLIGGEINVIRSSPSE